MELTLATDHTDQVRSVQSYGIETVGDLLKRLAAELELGYYVVLELEFCGVVIPHEHVLSDQAIVAVSTLALAPVLTCGWAGREGQGARCRTCD